MLAACVIACIVLCMHRNQYCKKKLGDFSSRCGCYKRWEWLIAFGHALFLSGNHYHSVRKLIGKFIIDNEEKFQYIIDKRYLLTDNYP